MLTGAKKAAWAAAILSAVNLGLTHPGAQAFALFAIACGCALAALEEERSEGQSRGMHRIALGGTLLLSAQTLSVLSMLFHRASGLRVETAIDAISRSLLVLGFWILASSVVRVRRIRQWQNSWVLVGSVIAAIALVHVVSGTNSVFGVMRPDHVPVRFFAPFVNPNHLAACLVMFIPAALGGALGSGPSMHRVLFFLAAGGLIATVVWVGAAGPLLVLGVVLVAIAAEVWRPFVLLAPAGALPFVWWVLRWGSSHGSDSAQSAGSRFNIWAASSDLFLAHPFLGAGPGNFSYAIEPFRGDHRSIIWNNAHNDYIEWTTSTGLVGVVFGLLAVPLFVPWSAFKSHVWRRLAYGAMSMLLFATLDFPLQVPALGMALGVVIAVGFANDNRSRHPSQPMSRLILVMTSVACISAGAWQVRSALAAGARDQLVARPDDTSAAALLSMVAPWGPERDQAILRAALVQKDHVQTLAAAIRLQHDHPQDASSQRLAALALLQAGSPSQAIAPAELATVLQPSEPANWHLRALAYRASAPDVAARAWSDAVIANVPGAMKEGWLARPDAQFWVQQSAGGSPATQIDVARFLVVQGALQEAEIIFSRALAEQPDRLSRPFITFMLDQKRYEQLLPYLERQRVNHPKDRLIQRQLAVCLEGLGRWEDAERTWLAVFAETGTGLGKALAARARVDGIDEALLRWRRFHSSGQATSDQDVIDFATELVANGRIDDATHIVLRHKFLSDKARSKAEHLLSK